MSCIHVLYNNAGMDILSADIQNWMADFVIDLTHQHDSKSLLKISHLKLIKFTDCRDELIIFPLFYEWHTISFPIPHFMFDLEGLT